MSVPKKQKTSSKTRKGRSHFALKTKAFAKCPKCGHQKPAHIVCNFCGTYKMKEIKKIETKSKK